MIILHGALLEKQLFLWGEAPSAAKPGARPRANGAAALYPYAAGFDALAEALSSLPADLRPSEERRRSAAAWLPTRGTRAIPSSPLVGEPPASRARPKMSPWRVDGLPLEACESLELLATCGERSGIHGIVAGRDLAFWTRALRFAGSLVARQRYLPGIERQGDEFFARWEPVWIGEDAETLRRLADEMPPVARALTPEGTRRAPDTPARALVDRFVTSLVDEIVRSHAEPGATGARRAKAEEEPDPTAGTPHDRWLMALRSDDARLHGDAAEFEALERQLHEWRGPVDQAASAPFRLCFRLEEPTSRGDEPPARGRNGRGRGRREAARPGQRRWYVRFLLQASDDPSLTVPTADAWITRGRKAAAISRMGEDVHESLLASLGQAAGVAPRIEESLRSRKPSGYSLDARGAYEFLTKTAPALQQAGFGVLLPEWWTEHGTRQSLSVRARVQTPPLDEASAETQISLDEVLSFDWEVTLGGRPLSGRELEKLARLKEPLVESRGQWVEVGVDEIHAAQQFFKNRKAGSMSGRDILQLALGAADTSAGIHFDGVHATGWLGDLLERLEEKSSIPARAAPRFFAGQLRPYQTRGFAWLLFLREWELGALLADDMGLGKTIQALALIQADREEGEDRPVLLVCPTSVLSNWEHEAARFTPKLPVAVHHGPGRERGWDFHERARAHGLVLTSYALLHRDIEDLSAVGWAGVILDEAQNIKNPETKQSQAARMLSADYRVAMTGTPVENHVGDLWSIMDFLNPGLLGSAEQFKRSFYVPIQAYRDREAAERLHRLSGPFLLRRLKTDRSIISDLPEKLEMKIFSTLTKEQGSLYSSVVDDAEKKIRDAEGMERRGVILATLSKLKQVCNHPAHFLGDGSEIPGRSGKLTRLTEMLEEVVESGDRSLVFTQFVKMGEILVKHLQEELGREVLFLHGGVTKPKRDDLVRRFQSEARGSPPVFVLSLKAGGVGLNLTRANHVFHFDRWWNPAVENQATDRAFRIGQTRNVQVHKFVCAGTLEERIDSMIESKRSVAENVVGTGETWITELSDDELHEMFALAKNAVRD